MTVRSAKPMTELHSVLRDIVRDVEKVSEIDEAKKLVLDRIQKIDHKDKRKMEFIIQNKIESVPELVKYIWNALLRFEGLGVISALLSVSDDVAEGTVAENLDLKSRISVAKEIKRIACILEESLSAAAKAPGEESEEKEEPGEKEEKGKKKEKADKEEKEGLPFFIYHDPEAGIYFLVPEAMGHKKKLLLEGELVSKDPILGPVLDEIIPVEKEEKKPKKEKKEEPEEEAKEEKEEKE